MKCFSRIIASVAILLMSLSHGVSQERFVPEDRKSLEGFLERDWDGFEVRLKAHLKVYESWLDQVCHLTGDQHRAFAEISAQGLARYKAHYLDTIFKNHYYCPEFLGTPILFGGADEAAQDFFNREIKEAVTKLLSAPQQEAIAPVLWERQQNHHQASIDQIIDYIDDLLFLHPDQKAAVRQRLTQVTPGFTHRFYTFRTDHFDFPERYFLTQEWFPSEIFSKEQMARAEAYRSGYMGLMETISADCTAHEFQRHVNSKAESHRAALDASLAVEIQCLPGELDPSLLDYLQDARKGAVDRYLSEWCRTQIAQLYQELPPDYVRKWYHIELPNPLNVGFDPVWIETFRLDGLQTASTYLSNERRVHLKSYMLMIFDQELWLTPEQRVAFEALVNEYTDRMDLGHPSRFVRYGMDQDLWSFSRLLYVMPEEKLASLLSPEQLKVWAVLKDQITVRDDHFWRNRRHGEPQAAGPYWLILNNVQ